MNRELREAYRAYLQDPDDYPTTDNYARLLSRSPKPDHRKFADNWRKWGGGQIVYEWDIYMGSNVLGLDRRSIEEYFSYEYGRPQDYRRSTGFSGPGVSGYYYTKKFWDGGREFFVNDGVSRPKFQPGRIKRDSILFTPIGAYAMAASDTWDDHESSPDPIGVEVEERGDLYDEWGIRGSDGSGWEPFPEVTVTAGPQLGDRRISLGPYRDRYRVDGGDFTSRRRDLDFYSVYHGPVNLVSLNSIGGARYFIDPDRVTGRIDADSIGPTARWNLIAAQGFGLVKETRKVLSDGSISRTYSQPEVPAP